jgi:hypothetical protein
MSRLIVDSLAKFTPPAGIGDLDQNPSLKEHWNKFISDKIQAEINNLSTPISEGGKDGVPPDQVCFFDPRKQPSGQARTVSVTWRGFPNILISMYGKEEAYKIADKPGTLLYFADPNANRKLLLNYREQDEYLEWVVRKDEATGKIKEIIFTCEGPEYWSEVLSNDQNLLLQLYKRYASPEVTLSDLLFSDNVYSKEGRVEYEKGTYNLYNKWNLSAAIHLTQPNNYLSAEINIAARSTVLRGSVGTPLSNDHALICCGRYGAVNRNSDPKIGAEVNAAVRNGNWVSLRDPIALYISDIDSSQFTKPDGSAIADFKTRYWNVVRGSADGKMILRATVKVPEDEMFDNKPLLLGDLLISGDQLQYGGQVADTIDVGLYATIVPGAPRATPIPCSYKCCQHPDYPNIEVIKGINVDCGSTQFTSVAENVSLPNESTRSITHQVQENDRS